VEPRGARGHGCGRPQRPSDPTETNHAGIRCVLGGSGGDHGRCLLRMRPTPDFSRHLLGIRVAERLGLSGILAGVDATHLPEPVAAYLPIVGAEAAMALGIEVGTGVAMGSPDLVGRARWEEERGYLPPGMHAWTRRSVAPWDSLGREGLRCPAKRSGTDWRSW